MSLTHTDHTDIGILVAFALRPTQRPGRNPDYQRVLGRYRTELEFKAATNAILHGLGAQVLSDGDFGLILAVEPESPLAFRISDMPYTGKPDNRLLAGLILTGLVAFAYPSAEELDDDRVRHISARDFDAWLRELCERLRSHDAAGDVIPEEGLDEAWRVYVSLPSVHVGETGRGAGKLSSRCTRYWVQAILTWLTGQGMARVDGSAEDTWTLTERFRVHAKELALERAYTFIAELQRRRESF
ncbi:hypothetical protein ACRYCC_42990 [Actinomadura scrupuli]|uniref:hypothetical protein n=1 Tax=Actinomadura scrupuli TaxID=559629 RepID=UPI003D99B405